MVLKYKLNNMYWLQNLISSQRNIPCEFIKTPKSDLEVHDVHEGEVVEGEGLDHVLFDVVDHLEL